MQLQAVRGETTYATGGRRVYRSTDLHGWELCGELPNPYAGVRKRRFDLLTDGMSARLRRLVTGHIHSVTVWPIGDHTLLANACDVLYRSSDGGESWAVVQYLHESSGMKGILPGGLTVADGTVYFGEYILASDRDPRIYASDDRGTSWRRVGTIENARHIHAVQSDPFTGDLWVTTGDTDDETRIGRIEDGEFVPVGGGTQQWRSVELMFTPEFVLWGTECRYEQNHVMRLTRGRDEPEVVANVSAPCFYTAGVSIDGEQVWCIGTGWGYAPDSTAPSNVDRVIAPPPLEVLAAREGSDFSHWETVARFAVRPLLANRLGLHGVTANAYLFLAGSPRHGIVINPMNTRSIDGEFVTVPSRQLAGRLPVDPSQSRQ